jgi:plasmid stabilization system protein ParE
MLLVMPFMCPEVEGAEGIRRCPITSHVSLYYKVLALQIRIVALVDNRQDPDFLESKIA